MAVPWFRFIGGLGVLLSIFVSFWLGRYFSGQKLSTFSKESFSSLPRIDPIKVGHVREIQLVSGLVHKMRTLSMRPALFEIDNFLSDEECDDIIAMAEKQGLVDSKVMDVQPDNQILKVDNRDLDKDGNIDTSELKVILIKISKMIVPDEVIVKMLADLELDTDGNGVLSYNEYNAMLKEEKFQEIIKYMESLKKEMHLQSRVSNVAWLNHQRHSDKKSLFDNIRRKIHIATGLPKDIIWTSEDLQVIKYDKNGHYHCHYDSENWQPNRTCCQYDVDHEDTNCLLSRYITFFYYLNEPEEGGETAFPIADDVAESLKKETSYLCDLSHHCKDANISYKPKRGTAIFWYNHYLNETTGWLGKLDRRSIHGGCDVTKGTKWSANNWINVGRSRHDDEVYWRYYKKYIEDYSKVTVDN